MAVNPFHFKNLLTKAQEDRMQMEIDAHKNSIKASSLGTIGGVAGTVGGTTSHTWISPSSSSAGYIAPLPFPPTLTINTDLSLIAQQIALLYVSLEKDPTNEQIMNDLMQQLDQLAHYFNLK